MLDSLKVSLLTKQEAHCQKHCIYLIQEVKKLQKIYENEVIMKKQDLILILVIFSVLGN